MIALSYLHITTSNEQHLCHKLQNSSNISTYWFPHWFPPVERGCAALCHQPLKISQLLMLFSYQGKLQPSNLELHKAPSSQQSYQKEKIPCYIWNPVINTVISRTIIRKSPQPLNHWLSVPAGFPHVWLVFHLGRTQPQIPFHALHCA